MVDDRRARLARPGVPRRSTRLRIPRTRHRTHPAVTAVSTVWWWAGRDDSLANALQRVARFLPEGQSLEARDVTGSVRGGGKIGSLQWKSPSMRVQVQDAQLGWSLAPLLSRTLKLGDVHIAEPGAVIGFAGARVIEQTIREKLPEGFQRAEYLRDHGMVDMVVARVDMRATLARICRLLTKRPQPAKQDAA